MKGIIVSIQGYSQGTTNELAAEAIAGGAVAIRTDKAVTFTGKKVPVIGLQKIVVDDPHSEAYLTPTVRHVKSVQKWADIIAFDARRINKELEDIILYCKEAGLQTIADIGDYEDFEHLQAIGYSGEFISTTFSVFRILFHPDIKLAARLSVEWGGTTILEGNVKSRKDIEKAYSLGVHLICIGGAIANVYKLTRKFVTVKEAR